MTSPASTRTRLARTVVLLVVAALMLTGCNFSIYSLPLPGGVNLGSHPYAVTVDFRDVLDLVPQSAVKVDDVTVGRVDSITLRGYTAQVRVLLRGNVKLPDNAVAGIQQTSLLGEKFVSLSPPPSGQAIGRLGNGDVIPLSRSGRDPVVEEVLGALSLVLNGGGVARMKTIATEVNKALSGNEPAVRSVLVRLKTFMGTLSAHKGTITKALDSLDRLSVTLNQQKGSIAQALDQLPRAIRSINSQRDDLVRMLKALARLSKVGTKVIQASKVATIDSLRSLAPTLTELARAGSDLPKSLQVFLTYPFVDAVVGTNPAQARNLHMGDYTDLSVRLDLDLTGKGGGLPNPGETCKTIPGIGKLCGKALKQVQKCLANPSPNNPACANLPKKLLKDLCQSSPLPLGPICPSGSSSGGIPSPSVPNPTGILPSGIVPSLGLGLPRAPFGGPRRAPPDHRFVGNVDTDLGALLVWGMMPR